ncbi:MAG: BamA/TamA family outer membrane protein [Candidatus Marinimicrobia bacterium]|nr:BamA/TamA family outer membrane protein [Candidatus Neomarinimicrobiota bacterium]
MKRIRKIILILLSVGSLFAQNSNILSEYRLQEVFYNGNTSFTDRQLKRYVGIKPARTQRAMERITYRYIKSQAKSLKNYYISEGFLNCDVRDSLIINQEKELHLYFNIDENERYLIKQISIEGNTLLTDGEVLELLEVKVGEPFRQYIYYNNFKKILSRYSELGHPFAGIREEYDWSKDLEIALNINEDISYNIDKIKLSGNKNVGEPYIRKHFIIEEGEPYQLDKINRTQDRIYEMGTFNSVNIVPVNQDISTQTLDLNVSVIESKERRFDFELGARQSYNKKISYSSLYIQPEWTHKNLFHRAHRFRAGLTYDAQLQNIIKVEHLINAELAYTVPWIVFLRLPTTFKVYYDREGYSPFSESTSIDTIRVGEIRTKYGVNVSSIWRYNRNIYTRTSISLENFKSEFNNNPEEFKPQTEISLQSRFDNRDNFIYPTKGWNILLYSGYVLGAERESGTEYFRLDASVNAYGRLARNMVLAGRLEVGQFFDMKSIDPTDLYQLGSESTLRGWKKSIGNEYEVAINDSTTRTIYAGNAKMMANVELRFDLPWNFGIDVFLDAGRLDNDLTTIANWDSYYVNTGFGIYYKTPIGPIRVEFPILLNDPNIALDRDQGRKWYEMINFGLLFAF